MGTIEQTCERCVGDNSCCRWKYRRRAQEIATLREEAMRIAQALNDSSGDIRRRSAI